MLQTKENIAKPLIKKKQRKNRYLLLLFSLKLCLPHWDTAIGECHVMILKPMLNVTYSLGSDNCKCKKGQICVDIFCPVHTFIHLIC